MDIRYNIRLFTDWYNKNYPEIPNNKLFARLSKFGKDFWLWGKDEQGEIMLPLDDEDLKYLYDKYTNRYHELEEQWKQKRLEKIKEQQEELEKNIKDYQMKIKFKKLHPNAVIPKQMTEGAACADVIATEILSEGYGAVTVKLGFSTEIPQGYKAVMSPRSSFTHQGWTLQNSPCQIDSDYRGEWMIKFEGIPTYINDQGYLKYDSFPYNVGDRVAQMWIEKVIDFEFQEVEVLSKTERGTGGFGSTNK